MAAKKATPSPFSMYMYFNLSDGEFSAGFVSEEEALADAQDIGCESLEVFGLTNLGEYKYEAKFTKL